MLPAPITPDRQESPYPNPHSTPASPSPQPPMFARVYSAALQGVDAMEVGDRGQRKRGQRRGRHRRPARHGGEGKPRPGLDRHRKQRLRQAQGPRHRQPRPRRREEGRPVLRPPHRPRHDRRCARTTRKARSTSTPWRANSPSTAASAPCKGVLSFAIEARERGRKAVIVPEENADEAAMVEGIDVYGVANLRRGRRTPQGQRGRPAPPHRPRRTSSAAHQPATRSTSPTSRARRTSSARSRSPSPAGTTSS